MIDIERIKQHLRIDPDEIGTLEDAYIETLEQAAIQYAEQYINKKIVLSDDDSYENSVVLDQTIECALLLIIGHLYEHREDVTDRALYAVPMGSRQLLNVHRLITI